MQNDLVDPDGFFQRAGQAQLSQEERAEVVERINTLVQAMRQAEWPVVQACWQLRPDHLDACYSIPWRRLGLQEAGALVRGSWGAELAPELLQGPDDFVVPLVSHS